MKSWSATECEFIVADYFTMLKAELSGREFNKAEHRRNLAPRLNRRSEPSIEYKHQNISAILIEMGYTYISGYKPAFNYQALLATKINDYLNLHEHELIDLAKKELKTDLPEPKGFQEIDWNSILTEAPEKAIHNRGSKVSDFVPKRFNFSEIEQNNTRLGKLGERFALHCEKARLISAGKKRLAADVEWTSNMLGDGAGYDILSFNAEDESPRYIEVKTTNAGKYQPFYISSNELGFANQHLNAWSLYRVFHFRTNPKLFTLSGPLGERAFLEPKVFIAGF